MDDKPNAVYSNLIGVSQSPFEVRLEFSLETPTENDIPIVEKLVDVRLSPQTAKALRDIMDKAILFYEENVGVIPALEELGDSDE